MAIQSVRANLNGTWYTLTYNEETRFYEAEITAPGTSYHQPGGVYDIQVEAVSESGILTAVSGADHPALLLEVYEVTPPEIALESPAEGHLTTPVPTFVLTITDAESGVDEGSIRVFLDGVAAAHTAEAVSGGYTVTVPTASPLADGPHELWVLASDHDGNSAELTGRWTIDTTPPVLALDWPGLRAVFDTETVSVRGTVRDVWAPPVTVTIRRSGADPVTVPVAADGSFALALPVELGENTVTVTAADDLLHETVQTFPVYRLITDRTAADADLVRSLTQKWKLRTISDAEKAAWDAGLKGGYNASDLNRVGVVVLYLASVLQALPEALRAYLDSLAVAWDAFFDLPYDPAEFDLAAKTDWTRPDVPTPAELEAYLENVRVLQSVLPHGSPTLPDGMARLGHAGANAIEGALVDLDAAILARRRETERYASLTARSFTYAGEALCGEF